MSSLHPCQASIAKATKTSSDLVLQTASQRTCLSTLNIKLVPTELESTSLQDFISLPFRTCYYLFILSIHLSCVSSMKPFSCTIPSPLACNGPNLSPATSPSPDSVGARRRRPADAQGVATRIVGGFVLEVVVQFVSTKGYRIPLGITWSHMIYLFSILGCHICMWVSWQIFQSLHDAGELTGWIDRHPQYPRIPSTKVCETANWP